MQRTPLIMSFLAIVGTIAFGGMALAQSGGIPTPSQERPAEAPPSGAPSSAQPQPKAEESGSKSEEGREAPQQGGGCRYFERKLELIV